MLILVDEVPDSVDLAERKLVVVLVVQNVDQISIEWVHIVQLGELWLRNEIVRLAFEKEPLERVTRKERKSTNSKNQPEPQSEWQ